MGCWNFGNCLRSAKKEKTLGRVFVGLDLVDYSDESEDEAYGEDDKGNKVYFVHFFVNQINADIAWDTAEKPELCWSQGMVSAL